MAKPVTCPGKVLLVWSGLQLGGVSTTVFLPFLLLGDTSTKSMHSGDRNANLKLTPK